MHRITTPIIPQRPTFAKVRAPHELHKEAICIFAATGFFLDTDTYYKDRMVLPPASESALDADGYFVESTPWFHWHHTPRAISFETALAEFTKLFENVIVEQVGSRKVILPLSGGLDSRTQAVALTNLGIDTHSYSYDFTGGFKETAIAKKIAQRCDFDFSEFQIPKGYLWDSIEELAEINGCHSEFTHARQMAFIAKYEAMGDIFSLGHWGDVLFDSPTTENLPATTLVDFLLKKITKKGGMELAEALWEEWGLESSFEDYLRHRVRQLLDQIAIEHTGAKLRAFKSMYWAPRWTASNLAIFEEKRPITLPYFDDRMCEFICTIPEEFLVGRKIQIAYINQQNPALGKITWQDQKPYNLFNYNKNKPPANIPYRIKGKILRTIQNAAGKPYVQRNWELQFLGMENDARLQEHLFSTNLHPFLSKPLVAKFYNHFKNVDPITYAHPVSMLLTLSVWHTTQRNRQL